MTLPPAIAEILHSAASEARVLPPTVLYCEGWMLRLVLHAAHQGIPCLPFGFAAGARWFSEASLYTAFAPSSRSDTQGEKHTRADGVIGHFAFKPGTKTGLLLAKDATQFVVVEAKIGSRLSAGTANAKTFNQATRNVACIAHTLAEAGRLPHDIDCGFWVFAPDVAIARGLFGPALEREGLARGIDERIQRYSGNARAVLDAWYEQWVKPTIASIQVGCWSWEESIARIEQADPQLGEQIGEFYSRTIKFSGSAT